MIFFDICDTIHEFNQTFKENIMNYKIEKKDNGCFDADITVEKAEWESALNTAYEKNKGKYNIAGFRKGHAPRNIIEKNYGQGTFYNEALDEIYYAAYTQILREHEEIKPIDAPKLEIKKLDADGLQMVLSISCIPEFSLAKYKGLKFERAKVSVDEKQIEQEIERELLRSSRLVETKAPVKDGDFVTLDFDGYIDGKQFEGGKSENYQLKIGSKSFIDNFEDQLIGLNIGDKKDVNVTFPADYHAAELKGKPACFKVEIKNIRERIMPKLDEEFVTNSTEYNTVDEYKASIKEKLLKQENDRADIELDNDILDKIIDDTEFTAPEVMVDEEFERQYNGMLNQMRYQGIKFEDYAQYIGKTTDELKEEIRNSSRRNVKARVVLEKLIRDENLDITEADIDKKVEEMAKNTGKSLEEYKKEVNNDMVNQIANELLMKKLINFLHENNEIK